MQSKGRRAQRPISTPMKVMRPADPAAQAPKPADDRAEQSMAANPMTEAVMPAALSTTPPSVKALVHATKNASSENFADFGSEAFAALAQSQTAMARGLGALGAELAGLALSGIDTAARTATDILEIETLSDAIAVNVGFTRSGFDALLGGSARLSELGVKLAAEATQSILTQLGKSWIRAARLAF
jgi:hypothetical protein